MSDQRTRWTSISSGDDIDTETRALDDDNNNNNTSNSEERADGTEEAIDSDMVRSTKLPGGTTKAQSPQREGLKRGLKSFDNQNSSEHSASGCDRISDSSLDRKMPARDPGEDTDDPQQSSGGIAWLSGVRAETLEKADLPEYVRKHNATLTFPEKLMIMLTHIEKVFEKSPKKVSPPVEWVQDGFVVFIRDRDRLAKDWLPLFFQQTKFSSFTRKLYRWGFRQYSSPGETSKSPTSMYFFNENFRRDDHSLLSRMKSITAAGTRREQAVADAVRKGLCEQAATTQQLPVLNQGIAQLLQVSPASASLLGVTPGGIQPHPSLSSFAASAATQPSLSELSQLVQTAARDIHIPPPAPPQRLDAAAHLQQLLLTSQGLSAPDSRQSLLPLSQLGRVQIDSSAQHQGLVSLLGQLANNTTTEQNLLALLQQQQQQQQPVLPALLSHHAPQQQSLGGGLTLQNRLQRALLDQQQLVHHLQQQQQHHQPPTRGQGLAAANPEQNLVAVIELLNQLQGQTQQQPTRHPSQPLLPPRSQHHPPP